MGFYEQKYREIVARMHTCSPTERDGLKGLLDYYYGRMQTERVMRRLAQKAWERQGVR